MTIYVSLFISAIILGLIVGGVLADKFVIFWNYLLVNTIWYLQYLIIVNLIRFQYLLYMIF